MKQYPWYVYAIGHASNIITFYVMWELFEKHYPAFTVIIPGIIFIIFWIIVTSIFYYFSA
ncbi:hypothetical protein ABID14_001208 [Peptoniphilus olsenii]|uniref:Uncharacterized protein n=1 Tax=Peptoniphilus olsenii TaxID=411570 RepID=A0ABV2JCS0_9FIRM